MNIKLYSEEALEVIQHAQEICLIKNHAELDTLHVLSSLCRKNFSLLESLGRPFIRDKRLINSKVDNELEKLKSSDGSLPTLSQKMNEYFQRNLLSINEFGVTHVSIEILCYNIMIVESTAKDILAKLGATKNQFKKQIKGLMDKNEDKKEKKMKDT